MTTLEKNKLKKKIERQQAKQDKLFGNYGLSQKKATKVKFSNNGLWRHNNITQVNEFQVVINGKLYTKKVR